MNTAIPVSQTDIDAALARIAAGEADCFILRPGCEPLPGHGRGVRPLLQLLENAPETLHGAVLADKIIGKAAAAIMATGGVVEVHTNIISTPARALLEAEGIKVVATEEVPQILNRNKSQMCPIDSQLEGIESIEECVTVLQNMLITL